MNKSLQKITCVLLLALVSATVQAQTAVPEDTSLMHRDGKLYVVVAVVVTILLGLFFYVFSLDRKISRLEKK